MSATIHYHDIGDIDGFEWQTLTPDKHGDSINATASLMTTFLLPLKRSSTI